MRWRRTLVVLHRDVGFFCVGLTLVYAVSGIAVNHRQHWDYNYSTKVTTRKIGGPASLLGRSAGAGPPGKLARDAQNALVDRIVEVLGRQDKPRKVFWRGPDRLSLFFGTGAGDIVDYHPSGGTVEHINTRPRPLIRQVNFLHLNEARGAWTYLADAFAVLLIFLAVSGAIVVKGRSGLKGRGGLYLLAGVILPSAYYLLVS